MHSTCVAIALLNQNRTPPQGCHAASNHGTSTFTGHSNSAVRFWPAGEMSPNRFWPAGMTKQKWHILQHMQQTQTLKRKQTQHIENKHGQRGSNMTMASMRHIEKGDDQQGSNMAMARYIMLSGQYPFRGKTKAAPFIYHFFAIVRCRPTVPVYSLAWEPKPSHDGLCRYSGA